MGGTSGKGKRQQLSEDRKEVRWGQTYPCLWPFKNGRDAQQIPQGLDLKHTRPPSLVLPPPLVSSIYFVCLCSH